MSPLRGLRKITAKLLNRGRMTEQIIEAVVAAIRQERV
jgi:hypothetical protein